MKKGSIIISIMLWCLLFTSCIAIRAGANFGSESSETDSPGFDSRTTKTANQVNINPSFSETGFYIGLALNAEELEFSEGLSVQPEINFIGIKDLNQIQVPVLAKYNFAEGFNVYTGPNFGFLLDSPNGIKSFNFALDIGLSYDITDNILIEARYDYGLSNLAESGSINSSVKLRNFQVGLAYRLNE